MWVPPRVTSGLPVPCASTRQGHKRQLEGRYSTVSELDQRFDDPPRSFSPVPEERDTMTQEGMTPQGSTPRTGAEGAPGVTIANVRFEHHRDALGVGEVRPRLSWIVATTTAGWRQAGYEIEAYGVDGRLRDRTSRGQSDQSVLVHWPFAPLSSRERLMVRVRVWSVDGQVSAWSEPSPIEAGLLHTGDWTAQFMTP